MESWLRGDEQCAEGNLSLWVGGEGVQVPWLMEARSPKSTDCSPHMRPSPASPGVSQTAAHSLGCEVVHGVVPQAALGQVTHGDGSSRRV